jgi:hypothetical protein
MSLVELIIQLAFLYSFIHTVCFNQFRINTNKFYLIGFIGIYSNWFARRQLQIVPLSAE